MIDFNRAIELIRRNGGFKPNSNDSSYYRTYTIEGNRPLQARISNHGTWLWTWYDKQYDPSYAINTCVVYSENGEDNSNIEVDMRIVDNDGNVIGEKKPFEVTQYLYNCQLLDENDSILINQAVQNIWQNKGFKDPLANTPKHARVMILRPNEEPEIIIEDKTKYNMNNKLIRLTESDLHRIIRESVNKMLKEDYSTPPLKDRISFANYANVSDEGYIDDKEDFDSMASNLREVNDHLDEIEELLFNGNFEGIGDAQNGAEKYFDYLTKCINRAKKCVSRIVKLNQMNRGMQPNVLGPKNSSPIENNDRSSANPYYKRGKGTDKEYRYKSVDIYNPENTQMSYR